MGRGEPADEERTLADTFWLVARELRHRSREASAPWDLPPSQARALLVLGRHGTLRLHELAEHLRIARRSATEVVDALQDRDLVRRIPDPDDRRAVQVETTATGRSVLADLRAARSSRADTYFDRLGADDRATLARILGELTADDQLP